MNTADIHGTVTTENGAGLQGVVVALKDSYTKNVIEERVTDDEGAYLFSSIEQGIYRLRATMDGFETTRSGVIQLQRGESHVENLKMGVTQECGE